MRAEFDGTKLELYEGTTFIDEVIVEEEELYFKIGNDNFYFNREDNKLILFDGDKDVKIRLKLK